MHRASLFAKLRRAYRILVIIELPFIRSTVLQNEIVASLQNNFDEFTKSYLSKLKINAGWTHDDGTNSEKNVLILLPKCVRAKISDSI